MTISELKNAIAELRGVYEFTDNADIKITSIAGSSAEFVQIREHVNGMDSGVDIVLTKRIPFGKINGGKNGRTENDNRVKRVD